MKKHEEIHFIHISDTHLGSNPEFILREKNTYECTCEVARKINEFKAPVDFILHSGDVVNHPDKAAYDLTTRVFAGLKPPMIYVPGNHDDAEMVNTIQSQIPDIKPFAPNNSSYEFNLKGHRFLILDCKGPAEIDPHGIFEDTQEMILNEFLISDDPASCVIFLHFPPIQLDVPWIDRDMLIINGDRLHRSLINNLKRITAVFFGHVHRRFTLVRDGILYSSTPSPFCQFSASPLDEEVKFEIDIPVSFNYVSIENGNVSVMEVT
ncbi:MAG: metallophosphoesterase [Chitinispirillaceae bacterium]